MDDILRKRLECFDMSLYELTKLDHEYHRLSMYNDEKE